MRWGARSGSCAARMIRDAVGELDPAAFSTAEEFSAVFAAWVFHVGQGVDVEPMTLLGRVVEDPERVNGDIADLAETHPVVATIDAAEAEFRAVWERAEAQQQREYLAHAQQRASELSPGAIVPGWKPTDRILHPTTEDEAATRELRGAVEDYARERVLIIGTPYASGTVDSDTIVEHWKNAGLTWQQVLDRVTAERAAS